jgi:ABC-2 type transport system ATP-binding protein
MMSEHHVLCTLTGVEKGFTAHSAPVVGPLSVEVRAGEILGIRGPNGAGKSTLMALMAGVLKPDAGLIVYGPDVKKQIAYVPQELSLYSSMTGMENLRFWGYAAGLTGKIIKTRSLWLLEQLGLSDKANAPVKTYSGGMKRRLHLASALMVTPKLLLLDEPTVGADEPSRETILAMLRHLKIRGCGIVLITHQLQDLEVCDRIVTLEHGRFTETEEPSCVI